MPDLSKSAINLLQNLDLESIQQIRPQQLESLITALQKSHVREKTATPLRTTRLGFEKSKNLEILKLKNLGQSPVPPTARVEYEVEQQESFATLSALKNSLDLSSHFTVADKVLGPFKTLDGPEILINIYRYIDDFKIMFPGEIQAALILPVRLPRIMLAGTRFSTLTLVKGSVWIRADLLDPAAPKDKYIGLRISSGTVNLGGNFPSGNNSIQIPKTSQMECEINLDNSYQPEAAEAIGTDGRNSIYTPTPALKLKSLNARFRITSSGKFTGKTLGQDFSLSSFASTFAWDAARNNAVLNLNSAENQLSVRHSESDLYHLEGRCQAGNFRWMLPSRNLIQNQSIEVKFNGVVGATLGPGLNCNWDGIRDFDTLVKINSCELLFMSGLVHISSEKADFGSSQDFLKLWQQSAENAEKMELKVGFMDYGSLQITSQSDQMDLVNAFADTAFYINKPLLADNRPVHPQTKKSAYARAHGKNGKIIMIMDSDMLTEDQVPGANAALPKYQFALENAYFTTTQEVGLFLNAKYEEENNVYEGSLLLHYGIYHILPTLPHPYTSNRYVHQKTHNNVVSGVFQSIINWSQESGLKEAKVTFKMNRQLSEQSSTVNTQNIVNSNRYKHHELRMNNNFMLFDVSTESDHWGVALTMENREIMRKLYSHDVNVTDENVVTIHKNYLQTPMGFMHGLTLPHISWEPVANITPKDHNMDPPAGVLNQKNNSVPTVFTQLYNKPVKIHPRNYMETFRQTLKSPTDESKNLQSKILFTLPNGKLSVVSLNPYSQEKMWQKGHLDFIMPKFKHQSQSLQGGLQFRISAFKDPNPDQPPRMRGKTEQLYNLTDLIDVSILGQSVTSIFNGSFNPQNQEVDVGVPITHIDFSGYGASTFSNWQNPTAKFAAIAQAKFDVLKGRTAYELVQAVSVIYPWGICTTRTVTFLRNNNAIIFREDSGWVAKGDGLFDFSFHWPTNNGTVFYPNIFDIYPGLVQGLFNVTNIKEDYNDVIKFSYDLQNGDFSVNNSTLQTNAAGTKEAEFVAVYFDADVKLDPLDNQVTGKRFKGYLQLQPQGVPVPARILRQILDKSQNPVSGEIDTLLPVESTLQKFKTNAVEVNPSYQNDNTGAITFVASVKGSVILPPDGSWSVVEVDKNSGVVQNLISGSTVGLVKDGLRPKNHGNPFQLNSTKTLVAFPDGLKNSVNSFSRTYGFLQNTETQKLLLNSVQYIKGQADKYTSDPALLADSFRLLNSKGPFPNLSEAIKVDNAAQTVMDLLPDGPVTGGVKKTFNYEVPSGFDYDIVGKKDDAFRIYINYNAAGTNGSAPKKSLIRYITDSVSEDRWSNQMQHLTIGVDLVFKPIMHISGDFGNGKKISAGFNTGSAPQLKLCKELQTIYDILEFLNSLDPTQPSEAVKKALKIVMSNSADSWEYKFKADKEIPLVKFPFDPVNYNSPTTPLKLDAFFRLGVYFNQPIKIPNTIDQLKPSVGAYLELGADLRVMCVSVAAATIYAVGRAEVGLAADLNNPPTLYFKFGFGVELAVGLPVIGSVAVLFMVGVDIKINSVDVIVGAFIYFRGRVEILGGIVTITISIEAAGQIHKKVDSSQPTNCIAKCTFALDISIAFVVNINFTETWEETRQIS